MSLDQIDDLCDRFESALRDGESVRIEDFLEQVPEEKRSKLLRELLEIEIELAAQKIPKEGESISQSPLFRLQDSLKGRFTDQNELIDSVVRRVAKLRQIGDYEILEELGHGGMGVVFKARQKLLNQIVAIKVLSQTLLDDPQAVGRFRREMQLIGRLNHPNIVRALNAGESNGAHYLVMEFVDGVTLQLLGDTIRKEDEERIRNNESGTDPTVKHDFTAKNETTDLDTPAYPSKNAAVAAKSTAKSGEKSHSTFEKSSVLVPQSKPVFTIPAACEAIRQAALGLQHAHEYDLVHRDIKPANLMIDRTGTVKILDLGLGKFLDEHRAPGESASLTMAGTTIGTIDYISPEQCENAGDVDIRADLYSLGCTLYFLISGRPPYSGSRYDTTRKKLMAHIVGEVPKLTKILRDFPPELERILEKLLAKEPEERFQTPIEVADALEPFSSVEELHAMIDAPLPSGIRRSPGSTGKILGTSDTLQTKAVRATEKRKLSYSHIRKLRLLSRILIFSTIMVVIVATGTVLGLRYFFRTESAKDQMVQTRQGNRQEIQQAVPQEPRPAVPQPQTELQAAQKETVKNDLALLPGLNGSWWFEEMPWLLPQVRQLLLRKIDEAEDLKSVIGGDVEKYYDPNVPAVYDWLWSIAEKYRKEISPSEFELIEMLKSFNDSDFENETGESFFQKTLDFYLEGRSKEHREKNRQKNDWSGVELHTRALLEHRLAGFRSDRSLAETAVARYNAALAQYHKESQAKNMNESPTSDDANSRSLELLCMADAARLEYLATNDYRKAIQKFETVIQERRSGERFGALFIAELWSAQGTLCAEAGLFDDALFTRGLDRLSRSPAGKRMHPLTAQLTERYAWSLLDQWKVAQAERQFGIALVTREANRRESQNQFATIPLFHDMHGLALTYRYLGNSNRAVEEFRRTREFIDTELEKCRTASTLADFPEQTVGSRRYYTHLKDRAANTRERLADCTFYGGAASDAFSQPRLRETAKLYEEAAELYGTEGEKRTMQAKQAVILLLLNEVETAEQILNDLDNSKRSLLGNQLRTELVKQVADALLLYQKETDKTDNERKQLLRQFLRQFTIPSNPVSAEAGRRETFELRLFCAEWLVNEALDAEDYASVGQDLLLLMQPLGDFMNRLESRPFLRRICDKIVQTSATMYDRSRNDTGVGNPVYLQSIVRLLPWLRMGSDPVGPNRSRDTEDTTSATSTHLPTLVIFFLTENTKDGFVVFYPQDGRPGELYRLPLARRMLKSGESRKQGDEWKLDPRLLESIQKERQAGRPIQISWGDTTAWPRSEDALHETDWPFGGELKMEN